MLLRAATTLAPLLHDVVFVGGHVTELLVSGPAAVPIRVTDDVDVVVDVASRTAYERLGERLRALGLHNNASSGAPICRWRTNEGIVLDVMPIDEDVLGFTNPWYVRAVGTAMLFELAPDVRIRVPDAPTFLATKWAAYEGRGAGDLLGSHDLEDIIAVTAGRPRIVEEVLVADATLRRYLGERSKAFLEDALSPYAIEGALTGAGSVPGLIERVVGRFRDIAASSTT